MKKILPFLCLTIVFMFIATSTVFSQAEYDVSDLQNCKNVYTETNSNGAYLYGYTINCLYSAKILPEVNIRKLEVTGKIRSVTQYKSKTCALVEVTLDNYNVVVMDNNTGTCNYYEFKSLKNLKNSSFAVDDNNVYFIRTNSTYSYVQCYSLNGELLKNYKPNNEVTKIFTNNSKVYFSLYSGEIYRLNGNSYEYATIINSTATFSNAGAGWIYCSTKELVSLDGKQKKTVGNGKLNCVTYADNMIISSSGKNIFVDDEPVLGIEREAEFVLSYKDKYAVVTNDFTCTTNNISFENNVNGQSDGQENTQTVLKDDKTYKINADGILYGVESGTTISVLKKDNSISNVYDKNGNIVTSGKVKTGYSADVNGTNRLISVRGDITGEGNVKSNDVSELMSALTEKTTLSKIQTVSADYNFDGKVDNKDLVLIARKAEE